MTEHEMNIQASEDAVQVAKKPSRAKKKTATQEVAVSYEEAVARLETIVRTLEQGGGTVPLETCMSLYEEGVALVRRCYAELKEAEQRVQILQKTPDGDVVPVPFTSTED